MSTILDALRKVEEEQRARSTDARARLLSLPARSDAYLSRQRRTPWLVGMALVLAGFAAGAGLMLWGPPSRVAEEGQGARQPGSDLSPDKGLQPPVQPPAQALAQAPTEPSPPSPAETSPPPPSQAPAEIPSPAPAQTALLQAQSVTPPTSVPTEIPAPAQTALPQTQSLPPPTPAPQTQRVTPPTPALGKKPSVPTPPRRVVTPSPTPAVPAAPSTEALSTALQQLFAERGEQLTPKREQALIRRALRRGKHSPADLPPRLQELVEAAQSAQGQARSFPEAREAAPSEEKPAPLAASRPNKPLAEPRHDSPPNEAPDSRTASRTSNPSPPAPAMSPSPPNSSLSFLQWSTDPDKRIAFIKVNGGPLTLAHEGDTVGGYAVIAIRQNAVELRLQGRTFTLQVEE